ncbi:Uncharacterised protein [Bordetella pertussis]|nr:Uncharacterised protein [Bordetella pertussis]
MISAASRLPAARPAARSARVPRICVRASVPAAKASSRSPALVGASSVSTYTDVPAKHCGSVSFISGVKLPIRSRCTPGRSHSPRTSGSVDKVAQLTMSACPTAACRSVAACASKPCSRNSAARRCAPAGRTFHTSTRSIGRTARIACATSPAIRPEPRISNTLASARARYEAPSATAPAVR